MVRDATDGMRDPRAERADGAAEELRREVLHLALCGPLFDHAWVEAMMDRVELGRSR